MVCTGGDCSNNRPQGSVARAVSSLCGCRDCPSHSYWFIHWQSNGWHRVPRPDAFSSACTTWQICVWNQVEWWVDHSEGRQSPSIIDYWCVWLREWLTIYQRLSLRSDARIYRYEVNQHMRHSNGLYLTRKTLTRKLTFVLCYHINTAVTCISP